MAAAAGIVVAQDYAAPDSDNRTIKERLTVLQEVQWWLTSDAHMHDGHSWSTSVVDQCCLESMQLYTLATLSAARVNHHAAVEHNHLCRSASPCWPRR
jgi:hypothetical protein